MENFLPFEVIIEKYANFTKIASKLDSTFFTIRLWLLNCLTLITFDLFDRFSVDLVIFFRIHLIVVLGIIMAEPTREKLLTHRTFFRATSFIVLAAKFRVVLFGSLLLLLLLFLLARFAFLRMMGFWLLLLLVLH